MSHKQAQGRYELLVHHHESGVYARTGQYFTNLRDSVRYSMNYALPPTLSYGTYRHNSEFQATSIKGYALVTIERILEISRELRLNGERWVALWAIPGVPNLCKPAHNIPVYGRKEIAEFYAKYGGEVPFGGVWVCKEIENVGLEHVAIYKVQ